MLVSLAGVLGNLMLAFAIKAFLVFSSSVIALNIIVKVILEYTVNLNLMLIWLNILPVPPLDGFNVLTTLVRFKNMNVIYTLKRYGFLILIALMFFGVLGRYISFMSGLTLAGFTALFDLIQRLAGLI
jgi:Zn-dependent protease